MEAFSLLKYWRGGGGGGSASFVNGSSGGGGENGGGIRSTTTTTVMNAVSHHAAETDDDDDDDGPFFDLEFAVEEEDDGVKNDGTNYEEEDKENQNDDVSFHDDCTDQEGEVEDEEDEREFNFTISSNSSSNDRTDPNVTLSPSDDLFFKGRLVPIEPSSLVFNSAEPNSKPPQFPVSLLKSATKFRVAMLGFKKSKQNASEKTEPDKAPVAAAASADVIPDNTTPEQEQHLSPKQETEQEKQRKFFTVKFKVEEVPIVSLFTRDNNSSRKLQKQSVEDSSDDKKFSKDVMQKYLKKVKPLYIRVSKRYAEKLKFSGQLSLGSGAKTVQLLPPAAGQKPSPPNPTAEKSMPETDASEIQVTKIQKQANIPERLRVVCKQLGKSRSASSAVAAAPPQLTISRRDDSLLQQQDGIQSAILHCKRSFNASRDSESSILPRSVSDPSHQKSATDLSRKSSDEGKDGSFEP